MKPLLVAVCKIRFEGSAFGVCTVVLTETALSPSATIPIHRHTAYEKLLWFALRDGKLTAPYKLTEMSRRRERTDDDGRHSNGDELAGKLQCVKNRQDALKPKTS